MKFSFVKVKQRFVLLKELRNSEKCCVLCTINIFYCNDNNGNETYYIRTILNTFLSDQTEFEHDVRNTSNSMKECENHRLFKHQIPGEWGGDYLHFNQFIYTECIFYNASSKNITKPLLIFENSIIWNAKSRLPISDLQLHQ